MKLSPFQLGLIRARLLPYVRESVPRGIWRNKKNELHAYYWAKESEDASVTTKLAATLMIFVVALEKENIEDSPKSSELAQQLLSGLESFSKLLPEQGVKEIEFLLTECSPAQAKSTPLPEITSKGVPAPGKKKKVEHEAMYLAEVIKNWQLPTNPTWSATKRQVIENMRAGHETPFRFLGSDKRLIAQKSRDEEFTDKTFQNWLTRARRILRES